MTKQTFATLLCAAAVAGCTSTTVRKAEAEYQGSHLAYGAVVSVKPVDAGKQCTKMPHDSFAPVCANPAAYEQASIVVLHSTRFVTGMVFVPKDWNVKYGAILKTDPYRTVVATELAAAQPHHGCEWKGYALDKLTGKDRVALAQDVVSGLLIVPPIVTAMDDSFQEGGVECDGWSYRKLLHYS